MIAFGVGLVVGLIVGVCGGVLAAALAVTAARADDDLAQMVYGETPED